MEFVPEGYIDFIEAKNAVWEALHPGELNETIFFTREETRKINGETVKVEVATPELAREAQQRAQRVHERTRQARELLSDALRNKALTAWIDNDKGRMLSVPAEIWDTDRAWGTMQTGMSTAEQKGTTVAV